MAAYKLLVEGKDDADFFHAYCNLVIGQGTVDIFPPKKLDGNSGDGWGNLIKNLPLLLDQLKNGDAEKLGIILDADYPPDNVGGFASRYQRLTATLADTGYTIPRTPQFGKGDIFKHSNGLADLGLWITPDHQSDGMLENFIETLIASDNNQQSLLNTDRRLLFVLRKPITVTGS